jgi:hypothetical protein
VKKEKGRIPKAGSMAREQAYAGAGGAGGVEVWQGGKISGTKKAGRGLAFPCNKCYIIKGAARWAPQPSLALEACFFLKAP